MITHGGGKRSEGSKEHKDDWRGADIVVSTVQALAYNNKYKAVFRPTDLSLIIADESHRSISGNSRAVFEYFMSKQDEAIFDKAYDFRFFM